MMMTTSRKHLHCNVSGKQFNPWPTLVPPDLHKALSVAVLVYDGTRDAFEAFRVNLVFYLDIAVDFILQQVRTVYERHLVLSVPKRIRLWKLTALLKTRRPMDSWA